MLRLARLPRLYRYLKLVRLVRVLKFSNALKSMFNIMNVNKGVGKLVTVIITVFFIVHFVACLWYWIDSATDFEPDCWVVKQNLVNASSTEKYLTACYWAFQTLTTVGYGDVPVTTYPEQCVAIFWMVFGVGFYSFTIGNFQTILNEIDLHAYHLQLKLDTLLEFSKRTHLPAHLQK